MNIVNYREIYHEADSLFKDQDHLNCRGVRAFAEVLRTGLLRRDEPAAELAP